MNILTIFTPTYNRGYILPTLYQSLCKQTCRGFYWLIVDDGSEDNTKELVEKWKIEALIDIQYIYQHNGGKMRAHNTGVQHTQTDLFLCVDSDDYLVPTAVELILTAWEGLSSAEQSGKFAGIVAYKGSSESQMIETAFPQGIVSSTLNNLYANGFLGDTTLVFRTGVLKQHLFPEIAGEKFITEGYIYDQIDQQYILYILPEIITICSYLEDGYTKSALRLLRDHPKGWALYYWQHAEFSGDIQTRFYCYAQSICYLILAHDHANWHGVHHKALYCSAYPFGQLLAMKRKRQYRCEL